MEYNYFFENPKFWIDITLTMIAIIAVVGFFRLIHYIINRKKEEPDDCDAIDME